MPTQLAQYGRMLGVDVAKASVSVKIHWTSEGSVFAGTISSKCHGVETSIEIESDDDRAITAALVRNAEGGCYAQSVIQVAVPVSGTEILNGEPLNYDDYPRKVERR